MLIPNDEHIIIFFKRVAQPPNNFDGKLQRWGAIGQLLGCRMETNQLEISASITKISSLFKSNQQIKTNRNRSKSKKYLKCDSLPTPPTSVFVGFPACGVGNVGADADPDQHCGIDADLVAAVGPAQCGIRRRHTVMSWRFHGDSTVILMGFTMQNSPNIWDFRGVGVSSWDVIVLIWDSPSKRIKYLKLVGTECGFILNILAKYWEYNDGEISQWGCHGGYLYKTWICWWFCDFRGKSTMFEGVEIYWDVVRCHFEQEIWRNCWWQNMASAFHMDARSWGNDQALVVVNSHDHVR